MSKYLAWSDFVCADVRGCFCMLYYHAPPCPQTLPGLSLQKR